MKVSQLIKVLEEMDPDSDIYHVTVSGVFAPITSVQEMHYKGFYPDSFVGICCGERVDTTKDPSLLASPVYISPRKKSTS